MMDDMHKWSLVCQNKRLDNAESQEVKAVFWVAKLREDPSYVCII